MVKHESSNGFSLFGFLFKESWEYTRTLYSPMKDSENASASVGDVWAIYPSPYLR